MTGSRRTRTFQLKLVLLSLIAAVTLFSGVAGAPALAQSSGSDALPGAQTGSDQDQSAAPSSTADDPSGQGSGAAPATTSTTLTGPPYPGGPAYPVQAPAFGAGGVGTVQVSRATTYYDVVGANERQLLDRMNRNGPREDGQEWSASVDWGATWTFPHVDLGGRCVAGPVTVNLSVTTTLPRWRAPASAPRRLVDRWNRFVSGLQNHEAGHETIALQAGPDILNALSGLGLYLSCADLDSAADAAGRAVVARYSDLQAAYDRDTGHGATQGAVFP
jgi:predicted secreted Zn-dependent protease